MFKIFNIFSKTQEQKAKSGHKTKSMSEQEDAGLQQTDTHTDSWWPKAGEGILH